MRALTKDSKNLKHARKIVCTCYSVQKCDTSSTILGLKTIKSSGLHSQGSWIPTFLPLSQKRRQRCKGICWFFFTFNTSCWASLADKRRFFLETPRLGSKPSNKGPRSMKLSMPRRKAAEFISSSSITCGGTCRETPSGTKLSSLESLL